MSSAADFIKGLRLAMGQFRAFNGNTNNANISGGHLLGLSDFAVALGKDPIYLHPRTSGLYVVVILVEVINISQAQGQLGLVTGQGLAPHSNAADSSDTTWGQYNFTAVAGANLQTLLLATIQLDRDDTRWLDVRLNGSFAFLLGNPSLWLFEF